MPKRNTKKKKKSIKPSEEKDREIQMEENIDDFIDEEVEKQIVGIREIRNVEIEQIVTALRLLRSSFTEEQLQTSVLDFFRDNLPGLTLSKNGEIELKPNDENSLNCSVSNGFSMGFANLCGRPSLGGYDLPDNVKANLLEIDNPQLENLVSQWTFENQMLASHDALRTPEVNGQRLSYGMTPKSRRLPKPGEMMVSVYGSPLGLYKEEDHNMGVINEEDS